MPFAGWEMPVQYEGVIPEHLAVRRDCGVFDVSHMGELEVEGPEALAGAESSRESVTPRFDPSPSSTEPEIDIPSFLKD